MVAEDSEEPPEWNFFQGLDLTQFPAEGTPDFVSNGCDEICTDNPPPLDACNPSYPRGCEELRDLGACADPDMQSTLYYPRGFCQYTCGRCNSECTPATSYRGGFVYQITSVDQVIGLAETCASNGRRRLLDASALGPFNLTAAVVA